MAALATLDVLTINLWGANGPARERMDALAGWLRGEAPDLVLLQEVERLDGQGQAHALAARAGYEHVDTIRVGHGPVDGEGLGVLSRHPLRARPPVPLPEAPADHPRAIHRVDVTTPAGTLRVGNTHLAWRLDATPARAKQARTIAEALPAGGDPTVVGGDLNDVPGSPALQALEAAGFADCCATAPSPPATFDRANEYLWQPELAGRRVDHLLARGLEVVDARVVLDGTDGPIVSDHYGVRVTLQPEGRRPGAEVRQWA